MKKFLFISQKKPNYLSYDDEYEILETIIIAVNLSEAISIFKNQNLKYSIIHVITEEKMEIYRKAFVNN